MHQVYKSIMRFATYMERRGLKDEDVAPLIRRSRVTVSRIRRGVVKPSWPTMQAIKAFSNGEVTADDFDTSVAAE